MKKNNVLKKIRTLLEKRLQGVHIGHDSQIIEIINTLIDDYARIYEDLEDLTVSRSQKMEIEERSQRTGSECSDPSDSDSPEVTIEEPKDTPVEPETSKSTPDSGKISRTPDSFSMPPEPQRDDAKTYAQQGWISYNEGDYEEAIAAYKKAIQLDPDYADAYESLASVLVLQCQDDEAIAAYREVLRLRPNDHKTYYHLAESLSRQGNHKEALAANKMAIESYCKEIEGHTESTERLEECRKAIKAIDSAADYVGVYCLLGDLFCNSIRDDEKAKHAYQQALRLDPGCAYAHCMLGRALSNLWENEEALAAYRNAIELKPDYVEAYIGMGFSLLDEHSADKAFEAFTKAIDLAPDCAFAYTGLGHALCGQSKYYESIDAFEEAIELNPDDVYIRYRQQDFYSYYYIGIAFENQGEYYRALDAYIEALDRSSSDGYEDDDDADVCYRMADVLSCLGRDVDAMATRRQQCC